MSIHEPIMGKLIEEIIEGTACYWLNGTEPEHPPGESACDIDRTLCWNHENIRKAFQKALQEMRWSLEEHDNLLPWHNTGEGKRECCIKEVEKCFLGEKGEIVL